MLTLTLLGLMLVLSASAAGLPPETMLRGSLSIVQGDPAPAAPQSPFGTTRLYYLATSEGSVRLAPNPLLAHVPPRSTIEVTGTAVTLQAALHGTPFAADSVRILDAAAATAPTSPHRLLVVDLTWNGAHLAATQAAATSVLFGTTDPARRSVKQYYEDASYGQFDWTGDVTPTLTIPRQNCTASADNDPLENILTAGSAAATTAGYDLTSYDNVMFNVPAPCLGGWSWGNVGGPYTWMDNSLYSIAVGYNREGPVHELGHNLGLLHAHGLDCGKVVISSSCLADAFAGTTGGFCDQNNAAPPCISEYGNPWEPMGNNWPGDTSGGVPWFGVASLLDLGWFDGRYTVATDPGSTAGAMYSLSPIEAATASPSQGLEIETASNTYYVELRAPIRQDAYLAHYRAATTGVIVTMVPNAYAGDGSFALDMRPNSNNTCKYCDFFDEALTAGRAFTDVDGLFTIKAVQVVPGTGATVELAWHTTGVPAVSSFTPTGGPAGTVVTISGSGFTGATAVRFGSKDAQSFTVDSDTEITATVGPGTKTGPVMVTGLSATRSSSTQFHMLGVNAFAPARGKTGTSVTITGSGFSGATAVRFGSTDAQAFTAKSDGRLTAVVAPGTTSGPVSVVTPDGTAVSATDFAIAPQIASFAPDTATAGSSVVIEGGGFTGATTVKFGARNAQSFTVDSDSQITAVVAAGTRSGRVSVIGPGGRATSTVSFRIVSVNAFAPRSGRPGTRIVVRGSGFTGTTAVTVGGTDAQAFTVRSDTVIVAVVASGTTTGPIAITTPHGTVASASAFTVR